jgi:hypothetical protein
MVMFLGCSKERTTEPANSLSGTYISNAFDMPDPADRPVDVQAAGGFIQMTFTNNTFGAIVSIPQSLSTVMGSGVTTYSGMFSLVNDTIKIDPASFIVTRMKWDEGSNSIESIPMRWGTNFVLQKK